jgi:RIO-like serine/threonine protein kinase
MRLDRVIAVRNNKTVFRDGRRCVKIFSADFSKANVFAEALNHVKVEECIDYVPKLLEVIRHERNWAIVYDFIKGKTVLQWMEDEPEALSDQVEYFVNCQMQVHQIKEKNLAKMKDAFFDAILTAPVSPSLRYLLHKELEQMHFSSVLCHADFVPSNVIIGEDTKPVVIDWASVLSGEPLADAAITYLLLKIRGWDAFAEEYRRRYVEKARKNESELEEWLPFAAVFLMNSTNEAERNALLPYVKIIESKGERK